MKSFLAVLALVGLGAIASLADEQPYTIYTCRTTASAANWAPPCWQTGTFTLTSSGVSSAPNIPAHPGSFYASMAATGKGFGCKLAGDTTVGLRWLVYIALPPSSGSSDIVVAISSTNATLCSDRAGTVQTTTTAFQNSALTTWKFVCFANPITTSGYNGLHPEIKFDYSAGSNGRFQADAVEFVPDIPCLQVAAPAITAPYITNMTTFHVTGVTAGATDVSVWKQMTTETRVQVGQLTSGIGAGANDVPLLEGATLETGVKIWATQTVGGQESCDKSPAYTVGCGNTALKFTFMLRDDINPMSGPVGAAGGISTTYGIYFLPAPSSSVANNPEQGVNIPASASWQSITVDPNAVTHGNTWVNNGGYTTRNPWASGRPSFQAIDSFCFYANALNTGPYEIYIDNLYSGATLIRDWEDAWADGMPVTSAGLFTTFGNEGTTSPYLTGTTSPLSVVDVATATNALDAAYYVRGTNYNSGTNAQYVKWQWKTADTSGAIWLRKLANAATEPAWVSYPQIDMSKPVHFDVLLAPLGSGPFHPIGKVSWMDDVAACLGDTPALTFSALPPGDPANYGQNVPTDFTWQWKKNGTIIADATGSAHVGATDLPATITLSPTLDATSTYSVVISDGTSTVTRSVKVSVDPGLAWDANPHVGDHTPLPAAPGDAVRIDAHVSGNACAPASWTYLWYKNGTSLGAGVDDGGGSTHFTINSMASSDTGTYTCDAITPSGTHVPSTGVIIYFLPAGAGIRGDYYNAAGAPRTIPNAMSGAPDVTRTDNNDGYGSGLFFNWDVGAPDAGINVDDFLVRWTGTVTPPISGRYFFRANFYDGARLWVKQAGDSSWTECFSAWANKSTYSLQSSASGNGYGLLGGVPAQIMIEYFSADNAVSTNRARFDLHWACSNSVSHVWESIPGVLLDNGGYPGIVVSNIWMNPAAGLFAPPTITMTSPSGSPSGLAPLAVNLHANVTANDGAVNSVIFYTNGVERARVSTAPYDTNVTFNATWTVTANVLYNDTWTAAAPESVVVTAVTVAPYTLTTSYDTGSGNLTVGGTVSAGVNYRLLASPTLTPPNWQPLTPDVVDTDKNATLHLVVPIPVGAADSMFFKAVSY